MEVESLRIRRQSIEKYIMDGIVNLKRYRFNVSKDEITTDNEIDYKKAELIFIKKYNDYKKSI